MVPSAFVARTTQRSPFFTHRRPVARSRLFSRVTTSSPTPATWPSATARPVSATRPAATRSARARPFSSDTVAVSGAIMRLSRPLADIGFPGPVQLVEHRLPLAPGDPPVGLVGTDGVLLAQAEAEAGRLLPLGLEALHVAQFGYYIAPVGHQQPERPARLQGRQLRPVAHQEHLGPRLPGGADQFVEGEGAGQAGLVHYHQLAGVQSAGLDGLVQGGQGVAQLPLGGKGHGAGWPPGPPAGPAGR